MISVIIPAYNDGQTIRNTVSYVFANSAYKRLLSEVIVVDSGSSDNTISEAEKSGAIVLTSPRRGRAAQLNFGAQHATGKIFYFLQPNALPPKNFITEIAKASSKGFDSGSFTLKFDYRHWLLNSVAWLSNRYSEWVQLSDQSLFMSRELFEKSGGFREDHLVMANQEMIKRLKRYSNFILLKDNIISSAKKYLRYGFFRTGFLHGVVYLLHKTGYSQQTMAGLYRKYLRWDIGGKVQKPKPVPVPKKKKVTQAVPLQQ